MYREISGRLTPGKLLRLLKFVVLIPVYRLIRQGPYRTLLWAFDRYRLFLTGVPTLRHARVTPNLYIGGQMRQEGWRRLQEAGVTSVVNMRREHDDRAAGLPIPPDRYLHLPTVDDTPVALEDLKRGADWIAEQVADGGTVYVHCAAGSGRAPSMGAAYLIAHHAMTADEALAAIRRARPFIMPMPSQVKRLHEFESWLRNGHTAE